MDHLLLPLVSESPCLEYLGSILMFAFRKQHDAMPLLVANSTLQIITYTFYERFRLRQNCQSHSGMKIPTIPWRFYLAGHTGTQSSIDYQYFLHRHEHQIAEDLF